MLLFENLFIHRFPLKHLKVSVRLLCLCIFTKIVNPKTTDVVNKILNHNITRYLFSHAFNLWNVLHSLHIISSSWELLQQFHFGERTIQSLEINNIKKNKSLVDCQTRKNINNMQETFATSLLMVSLYVWIGCYLISFEQVNLLTLSWFILYYLVD